jgi:high-affinity iron transporter
MSRRRLARSAAAVLATVTITGCGAVTAARTGGDPAGAARRSALTTRDDPSARSPQRRTNYIVPIVPIQLVAPLTRYTQHVDQLLRQLPGQIVVLRTDAARGDLAAAETAWVKAHMIWLELGQDDSAYGAFGELGEQIDGLAAGLPGTVANPRFTGFHKIELDLWRRHDPSAAAADAQRLATLVGGLTPARVRRDLPFKTIDLDSWVLRCHEILEDALRDSLSQNDDYGSNTDLASLTADVAATREMLHLLGPLITSRAPRIVPTAASELNMLQAAIAAAGGPDTRRNLALLPLRRRQAIDADTSAAAETLAPVSELMQVAVPGS